MATYNSTQSGDWSNIATWGGSGPPGDGDRAVINNTHIVEIDGNTTVGDSPADQTTDVISIQAGGTLKWKDSPGADWTLTVKGNIGIARLGRFEIGRAAVPIPATRKATLYFPTDLAGSYGWMIDNQGEFEVCGSVYHMADAAKQRTKLKADISAGAGVTFQTDDAVDWSVGDEIWVGTGGDPLQVVTSCEKITILTKTAADTYTADFANAHHDGDFLVHASRNVILTGDDNTKGVQIECTLEGNNGNYVDDMLLNMQWCYIHFFARGNTVADGCIQFKPTSSVGGDWEYHIPAGALILKNIVIDKGAYTSTSSTTGGIYVTADMDFQDTSKFIDEVHSWLQMHQFSIKGWEVNIGHITCLESNDGIVSQGYGSIRHDGYWYVWRGSGGGSAFEGRPRRFENFEIHLYYQGIYLAQSYTQTVLEQEEFVNGKIYHAGYSYACVDIYEQRRTRIHFENVELIGSHGAGTYPTYLVRLQACGPITFRNCSFDGHRNAIYGAIQVAGAPTNNVFLYNCTFGTIIPNGYLNAGVRYDAAIGVGRIKFEKCIFKKPPDADPDQPFFTDVFNWACSIGGNNPGAAYDDRMIWGTAATIEFIECQVLDGSDVDQWPNRYPGVTRLAFVSGGGEIRNEGTEIIDGTFAAKLLPFSPAFHCWVNEMVPVQIPVQSGQTVTAKLSFKRNANGQSYLPGLKLNGCGILDEEYLTGAESFGDWHELTVSGTATYDGVVELYISAGSNIRGQTIERYYQDTFYKPPEPTPPDWDDMFGVVVYADKLKVAIT